MILTQPPGAVNAPQPLTAPMVSPRMMCRFWTAKIIEAIDDAVPIGSVAYGPEAVDRVHDIFA